MDENSVHFHKVGANRFCLKLCGYSARAEL